MKRSDAIKALYKVKDATKAYALLLAGVLGRKREEERRKERRLRRGEEKRKEEKVVAQSCAPNWGYARARGFVGTCYI